jgi:hypothetical protein
MSLPLNPPLNSDPAALPSALALVLALSASLVAAVQAGPMGFIRLPENQGLVSRSHPSEVLP